MKTNSLKKGLRLTCPCYECIVRPLCVLDFDGAVVHKEYCPNYFRWRRKFEVDLSPFGLMHLRSVEYNLFFPKEKYATSKM
jgi:hypothetical protein